MFKKRQLKLLKIWRNSMRKASQNTEKNLRHTSGSRKNTEQREVCICHSWSIQDHVSIHATDTNQSTSSLIKAPDNFKGMMILLRMFDFDHLSELKIQFACSTAET